MPLPAPRRRPPAAAKSEPATEALPFDTQAKPLGAADHGPRFLAPVSLDFPEVVGELEALKPRCAAINFHTREGYESGKTAIQQCTKLRSAIESKRKELKEPALEWGRKVDAKAKDLVGLIEEIEQPLKARKLEVDKAEEARRREEERKAREAEELRLRTEREANEKAAREAAAKLALLEQKQAEMAKLEELWAKKHGTEPPKNEVAKPEPAGPPGIPPRRPAVPASETPTVSAVVNSVPQEGLDEYSAAVIRTLNTVLSKGYGFQAHNVGGAVQFAIHGNRRQWHATGNTLAQAVSQAWERHEKNSADDPQ